ncbi:unnamed protein product [Clonostachys rhizophaga]|uniref:Uncharacterized protein n=1 Tax=Clonostachys rhizophaga TaxID=160324 RepID=A0A9N9YMV0_9HYPO|nr:unnamed protein product [Clonostachys rhizophaga]
MRAEEFTDLVKYCYIVRSESERPIFEDGPETSNYQIEDRDFRRFVDGLKKPPGQDDAPNDVLMKQVCYAQWADRAQKLCLVRRTLSTTYCWTSDRRDDRSENANDTLYLNELSKPSVFDMEFSRNGRLFTGYFQEYRPNRSSWNEEGDSCVGAVTRKGKLLLRESTPICIPEIALFTVTLHRGVLRIVKHYSPYIYTDRQWSQIIYAEIDMASNKQKFERGIRTVHKLRMAAVEFWESVATSVGDPSTCDVAPDDWIPLQERLFNFPAANYIFESLSPRIKRGIDVSVKSRIGDEEFRTFKDSPWTTGSDSVRIFAKYASDHQSPPPFATSIPLTQLGLDPADPEYEPYDGYVPSNCYISVEEGDPRDYGLREKVINPARSFAIFTKTVIRLVKKELPFWDSLVAFGVFVTKRAMEIYLFYLSDSRRDALITRAVKHFPLCQDKEGFEQALRALDLVRKTAAEIRRRLCADVAARRTGEIHVPAEPDLMEVSRSEDEEISKVNDTMARVDLRAEAPSVGSAPAEVETNAASQRGQKRGREEDEDEAPQTMKHRRIMKMMPQACLGADAGSVGLAAADTKANFASQDDRRRRQDGDEGETAGTKLELQTGGGGMFGGPAPVDKKADPASQDAQNRKQDENKGETPQTVTTGTTGESQPSGGPAPMDKKANPSSQTSRKRRRDEDEDDVTHLTEKYRRLGLDSSSRRKVKVEGDHDA